MRVRQLFGAHRGEIVEMPYAVALRAIASGTVEDAATVTVQVAVPATAVAVQDAVIPERRIASPVDRPLRTHRRVRPLTR